MPEHQINIARITMSVVVIGFAIIFVAGTSIVKAGDKNEALINAASEGNLVEVKRLLAKGADVNAKDKDGMTALMLASGKGDLEVVKALLAKGADVNAKDRDGMTALMAASVGHHNVMKALLAKGADVNAKDKHGMTVLVWASTEGNIEAVNLLKAHGGKE